MRLFSQGVGLSAPVRLATIVSLVLTGLMTATSSYAQSYVLEPINDLSGYYNVQYDKGQSILPPINFINGSFDYNFSYSSGQQHNLGRYGFGASIGRDYYVNSSNLLGFSTGFHGVASSTFLNHNDSLYKTSLYDLSLLGRYHYQLTPHFNIGLSAGLAYVYGWVKDNPAIGFYSRFEPVTGVDMNYYLNSSVALNLSYLHYFGVASDKAYQSRQAAPTIDRISFGVSYVF